MLCFITCQSVCAERQNQEAKNGSFLLLPAQLQLPLAHPTTRSSAPTPGSQRSHFNSHMHPLRGKVTFCFPVSETLICVPKYSKTALELSQYQARKCF